MAEINEIIYEINQINNIFLIALYDEEGRLSIKISGSRYEDCEDELAREFNMVGKEHLLKGAKNVIIDASVYYEILFDSYIAYSTRWESFTTWDDSEMFTLGNKFRLYSQSKFLDYVKNSTFANSVTEYKHYGICCEWQIIDIASTCMPSITRNVT